jgi:hypothetical protein
VSTSLRVVSPALTAIAFACLTARRVGRFATFVRASPSARRLSFAAAGVELRRMVREGEQVSAKKLFEAEPCVVELYLRLFESFASSRDRVGRF